MRSSSLLLFLLLAGCDGDPPPDPDGGPPPEDAGMDAGPIVEDAGPEDAGVDAAPPDAGPPTVMEVGAEVMAELEDLEMAAAAVPMEQRIEGAFLDIAIGTSGIDALIGEDGLQTLALDEPMVRALTDLRHAGLLVAFFQRALDQLAEIPEPTIVTLRERLSAMIATLERYRETVAQLYRDRVDAGFVGTPVVSDPHFENRVAVITSLDNDLSFVLEGASATDETAAVSAECDDAEPLTIVVYDQATGAELARDTGSMALTVPVPVPFDTPTPVRMVIENAPAFSSWSQCRVSSFTRRNLRAAAVMPGAGLSAALPSWRSAVTSADMAMLDATSTAALSGGVLESTLALMVMVMDLVSPFTPSDILPAPLEIYQQVNRRALYVTPMLDAAIASPELAGADGAGLRAALTGLRDEMQALLTAATP